MPETPTTQCWFVVYRVWYRDGLGTHPERSRNALVLVHPLLWAKEWHDKRKKLKIEELERSAENNEGWSWAHNNETHMTLAWWEEVPMEFYDKVQVKTQDGQLYCPWT